MTGDPFAPTADPGTRLGAPDSGFEVPNAGLMPANPQNSSPSLDSEGTPRGSSSNRPATEGPELRMPEARRGRNGTRTSQYEAPAPQSHVAGYRTALSTPELLSGAAAAAANLHWTVSARSAEKKPIETLRLGQGPRRILVLSSLHGDEPQSIGLVEELARSLYRDPGRAANYSVLFIRSPNPDGVASNAPLNAHHVDLNRNFGGENWKVLPNDRGGTRPGAEPETQAVSGLLREFGPELVLHVKQSDKAGLINCEGPTRRDLEATSRAAGLKYMQDLGRATSGSLENYVRSRLRATAVTLLLPTQEDDRTAWARFGPVLRDAVGIPLEKASSAPWARGDDPFQGPTTSQARGSARVLPSSSAPVRDSARPGTKPKVRPGTGDFPLPIPSTGYVELPPPAE